MGRSAQSLCVDYVEIMPINLFLFIIHIVYALDSFHFPQYSTVIITLRFGYHYNMYVIYCAIVHLDMAYNVLYSCIYVFLEHNCFLS